MPTISFAVDAVGRHFSIRAKRNYAPAKSKVTVCEWADGTKEIHYRGAEAELA